MLKTDHNPYQQQINYGLPLINILNYLMEGNNLLLQVHISRHARRTMSHSNPACLTRGDILFVYGHGLS